MKYGTGYHANDARLNVGTSPRTFLPKAHGVDVGFIAQPANDLIINATAWGLASEQEFVYVGDAGIVRAQRSLATGWARLWRTLPTAAGASSVGASDLTLTHAPDL